MMKFEPGQRVKCIDGFDDEGYPKDGMIYTISEYHKQGKISYVFLKGFADEPFFATRFEPIEEKGNSLYHGDDDPDLKRMLSEPEQDIDSGKFDKITFKDGGVSVVEPYNGQIKDVSINGKKIKYPTGTKWDYIDAKNDPHRLKFHIIYENAEPVYEGDETIVIKTWVEGEGIVNREYPLWRFSVRDKKEKNPDSQKPEPKFSLDEMVIYNKVMIAKIEQIWDRTPFSYTIIYGTKKSKIVDESELMKLSKLSKPELKPGNEVKFTRKALECLGIYYKDKIYIIEEIKAAYADEPPYYQAKVKDHGWFWMGHFKLAKCRHVACEKIEINDKYHGVVIEKCMECGNLDIVAFYEHQEIVDCDIKPKQICCNPACGKEFEGALFKHSNETPRIITQYEDKIGTSHHVYVNDKKMDFCEHCGCAQLVKKNAR